MMIMCKILGKIPMLDVDDDDGDDEVRDDNDDV